MTTTLIPFPAMGSVLPILRMTQVEAENVAGFLLTKIMSDKHRFPYKWELKTAKFTKDKGKVFSCFACGGGSHGGHLVGTVARAVLFQD